MIDGLKNADRKTREKLTENGYEARVGDRVAGIWVCPTTGMKTFPNSDRAIYIIKGSRLKASWELQSDGSWMPILNTDTILPPPTPTLGSWFTSWKLVRFIRWSWRRWYRLWGVQLD